MDPGDHQARDDRGSGLIGTIAGVAVFLAFLLFAVQLLIDLYATSAVTEAAWDGARQVAGARVDHTDPAPVAAAQAAAEARMRAELGRFADRVTIDWSGTDQDVVVVRLRGTAPRFGLPGLAGHLGPDTVDRTARVRVEQPR